MTEDKKKSRCVSSNKTKLHLRSVKNQVSIWLWLNLRHFISKDCFLSVIESFSPRMLNDLFSLCVHQYSEVRVQAQEILLKVVGKQLKFRELSKKRTFNRKC